MAVACRAETTIRGKAVCARWNMPEEEVLRVDPCVHGTALGFWVSRSMIRFPCRWNKSTHVSY